VGGDNDSKQVCLCADDAALLPRNPPSHSMSMLYNFVLLLFFSLFPFFKINSFGYCLLYYAEMFQKIPRYVVLKGPLTIFFKTRKLHRNVRNFHCEFPIPIITKTFSTHAIAFVTQSESITDSILLA
jgi:hypothetical protein